MPYILNTDKDRKKMLAAIGVGSIEELYAPLPPALRLKEPLNLPRGLSEFELEKEIKALAQRNAPLARFNSFLGAGCYDHYLPAALSFILSHSSFLTAYTPYQAECSQGILQAIYEYQSYICLLTAMEVSNASLFDGASSLAEAVLMALRITKRKKILIAESIHPEYRQTLKTYLSGFDFTLEELKAAKDGLITPQTLDASLDNDTACCALQSPNFFGLIEDLAPLGSAIKEKGALAIVVTNPTSLAILKEPGAFGVDIVCGDGQPLGGKINFGGPSFGFLATKKDYLRQMPGRIVGKTKDSEGKPAYCLTLQAREQHIRREKATSNICSNQTLNAIGAAVYLSLMGKEGLRKTALYSFSNAQYLYQRLKEVRGINLPFGPRFFNEFIWEVKDAQELLDKLYKKNIIAGYHLGEVYPQYKNGILSGCTEKKTKQDLDNFVYAIAEILHG